MITLYEKTTFKTELPSLQYHKEKFQQILANTNDDQKQNEKVDETNMDEDDILLLNITSDSNISSLDMLGSF